MNWSEIINQTVITGCLIFLYDGLKKDGINPPEILTIGILVGILSYALEAGHL